MKFCSDGNHFIGAINIFFKNKSFRKIEVLEKCFRRPFTKFFNIWLGSNSNEGADACLEPNQTSTMDLFRKNSSLVKAVNYFHKKSTSEIFDLVLNMPLMFIQFATSFQHFQSYYAID